MRTSTDIMMRAWEIGKAIPAFNIPYLPMMEPVIRAVADTDSFSLVEVARLEWTKFEAGGPADVMAEFRKHEDPAHVRIHLDHVPVIDEDNQDVDYMAVIREAIKLGYQSVMVDASRLDLDGNIAATSKVAVAAHTAAIPCEAELGSVFGHSDGPAPPYEELFSTGKGFTDVDEAARFVSETGCDWLSVAFGSIHGAISKATRDQKKIEARLNLDHLDRLRAATNVPLVLHGGSGVKHADVLAAMKRGIAKINVGTEIRQSYEVALRQTGRIADAQNATYERTVWVIKDHLQVAGIRPELEG